MHEVSLMQQTLDIVLAHAERSHARHVSKVRLRIGDDSGVLPTAMTFAFGVVTGGTIAEGAKLVIETVPVTCYCRICDREFTPTDIVYECPLCGVVSSDVRTGRELEVTSIEVEDQ